LVTTQSLASAIHFFKITLVRAHIAREQNVKPRTQKQEILLFPLFVVGVVAVVKSTFNT